ncbi:MAG: hypothetical protein V1858_00770 [Candidatus Gottesmanbacteria bacterium]
MKIGIDISQLAYKNTGVANYLEHLVEWLLKFDKENEYILFYSSLRKKFQISNFKLLINNQISNFHIKTYPLPPTLLDLLWNRLHICPVEWFIGDVDVFITSDWTEPPTIKAKKATILYDLIVYKYPQETDKKIIETQKRKLNWVKQESDMVFCISQSTKKDAIDILHFDEKKLKVTYPGGPAL